MCLADCSGLVDTYSNEIFERNFSQKNLIFLSDESAAKENELEARNFKNDIFLYRILGIFSPGARDFCVFVL